MILTRSKLARPIFLRQFSVVYVSLFFFEYEFLFYFNLILL